MSAVKIDPFSQQPVDPSDLSIKTPQARVLAALAPVDPSYPVIDWPTVNRAQLGVRAGYTALSGSITRALNGIAAGSSSGNAYPGLLARGMIEEVVLDIEGTSEVNYRATALGIRAYQAYIKANSKLPEVKDASLCANLHQGKGDSHRSKKPLDR